MAKIPRAVGGVIVVIIHTTATVLLTPVSQTIPRNLSRTMAQVIMVD